MLKNLLGLLIRKGAVGYLLAVFLVPFAISSASAQTFTAHTNLPYVSDGNPRHLLDLYIPNGATAPIPLIIWIHGGGWQNGDKSLNPNGHQLRYARNGYAVASLNYRLSGEAIFPAQIFDCKAAIRWLRANAAQYNLDVTRFGVWGSSAGGHLAALLATSNDVVDLEGAVGDNLQYSSRVQAVVDWYGPTDLLRMDEQLKAQPNCGSGNHNSDTSAESLLIGCPIQSCPQAVQRANPLTYITRDDPPFLIEHGTADCTVPMGQSQILQSALQAIGNDSESVMIPGAGHGGPLFVNESNLSLVDNFWNTKLRQPANPLLNSIRVFRKDNQVTRFRAGSLGSLYRIYLSGFNLLGDSKVLINGVEKGISLSGTGEAVVNGLVGRVAPSGEVVIQIRNSNGRFSNVIRTPIE